MNARLRLLGLMLIAALILPLLTTGQAEVGGPTPARADPDQPHDLIFVVDVSGSMVIEHDSLAGKKVPASDPKGIRWDGIQFAIDIAHPKDRIALVLFGGDAAVLTRQEYLDKGSGFVEVGKSYTLKNKTTVEGRVLLKAILKELQENEIQAVKNKAPIQQYNLKALPESPFRLWDGTSVVVALETVSKKARLLNQLQAGHQAWMFLFTDGVEEPPFKTQKEIDDRTKEIAAKKSYPHQFESVVADYAYEAELKAAEKAIGKRRLARLVDTWVGPFRTKQVRIFTFAMGNDCDVQLLQAIAARSNPGRQEERIGAYYNPLTNLELLDILQVVGWELREYWKIPLERGGQKERERFTAPAVGPWRDLGLLLYRHLASAPKEAWAPVEGHVNGPWVGARKVKGWEPLTSRSHWYYSLDPAGARRKGVPLDQQVKLDVEHKGNGGDYTSKAVAAVRTREPLFKYRQPEHGSKYSPVDAIPFRIAFTPPRRGGQGLFRATDFEITARLTRVSGPGTKAEKPIRLPLVRLTPPEGKGEQAFHKDVVLDEDPRPGGKRGLLGLYFVDVTIRGKRGPLKGATRQLIRRTIEIVDYPDVVLPETPVILTNKKGEEKLQAPLTARLSGKGRRPFVILSARVRKPVAGKSSARVALTARSVKLQGAGAVFQVGMSGKAFAALPLGAYTSGKIEVRAPWSTEPTPIDLSVEKVPYELQVPKAPITLDFSDRSQASVAGEVKVALDTPLDTEEDVWLSTRPKRQDQPGEEGPLELSDGEGKVAAKLAVAGLGKKYTLRGGHPAQNRQALTLALTRQDLPEGKYTARLYVVGRNIQSAKVAVQVTRKRLAVRARELLVFDLSDKKKTVVPGELLVRLDTPFRNTFEEVRLSARDRASTRSEPAQVQFEALTPAGVQRTGPADKVMMGITGLGKRSRVYGPGGKAVTLSLSLARPIKLNAGWYQARLFLVGDATVTRPLTVKVMVDQVYVKLERGGGDPQALPDEQVHLFGLATQPVSCKLAFYSVLGSSQTQIKDLDQELKGRLSEHPLLRGKKGDRLPLEVTPEKDRVRLEVKVPASVHEGEYTTPLNFHLAKGFVGLRVVLRVAHFGARPDVQGPLRLKFPQQCAAKASAALFLKSVAAKEDAVQWAVRWAAPDKPGSGEVLEKGRLTVAFNGQQVLDGNKARDSVSEDNPCPLTVTARCRGLAPGLYRCKLKFLSSAGQPPVEGEAYDLDVEVLVPGRRLAAAPANGAPVEVGRETPLRVSVTCFDCAPGKGYLRQLDASGKKSVAAWSLDPAGWGRKNGPRPEVTIYQSVVKVVPRQAGQNRFDVHWPRYCPLNEAEGPSDAKFPKEIVSPVPPLDASGAIQVEGPTIFHVGEEVRIRAVVDPSSAPGGGESLVLKAVNPEVRDGESIAIKLYDDGAAAHGDEQARDGIYSGKHTFSRLGRYEISLVAPKGSKLKLKPAVVRVGFTYEPSALSREMLFGGGGFSRMLLSWIPNLNLESLSTPALVRVVNDQATPCTFRARLRYPAKVADSRAIMKRNLDELEKRKLLTAFDSRMHLKGFLQCLNCTGQLDETANDATELTGTLQSGEELELGVQAELSEDALEHLYPTDADGRHLTLDADNGLVVELQLSWPGTDAKRVLYTPLSVRTRTSLVHAWVVFAIVAALVAGIGLWIYRRRRLGKRKKKVIGEAKRLPPRLETTGAPETPTKPETGPAEKPPPSTQPEPPPSKRRLPPGFPR